MAEDRVSVFSGIIITIKVNTRPSSLLFQKQEIGRTHLPDHIRRGSLVSQALKNPLAMQETWVWSLGWEDPLDEGFGDPLQSSCLKNPHGQRLWVGYSPWGHRVGQDWATKQRWERFPFGKIGTPSGLTSGSEREGLPRWHSGKELPANAGSIPVSGRFPDDMQPTPAFLLGESRGQRSLTDYSPWGGRESDMAEWACTHVRVKGIFLVVIEYDALYG